MTHPTSPTRYWAGIDTHSRIHHIAIIDDHGTLITSRTIGTSSHDIVETLDWIHTYQPVSIGIEGTSSYGAGIANALQAAGHHILEVTAPNRTTRHRHGKSDHLDATDAADAARTNQRVAPPKNLTELPRLRVMFTLRSSAVHARTQLTNQIYAAARLLNTPIDGTINRTRITALLDHPDLGDTAAFWLTLDERVTSLDKKLAAWLQHWAPQLLDRPGVGPISATQLILTAGGNPDRLHSEASFARLTGVAPIPCSSGKTQNRHRLHRGGDRQANNALWRIAFHRTNTKTDHRTQAYIAKRTAQGKTRKDILRCLKRHLIREILPDLRTITQNLTTP